MWAVSPGMTKDKICLLCSNEVLDNRGLRRGIYCVKHRKARKQFMQTIRSVRRARFNPRRIAKELGITNSHGGLIV